MSQVISIFSKQPGRLEALKMAEALARQLEEYTREGLPACYGDSVEAYLYDFYPSLPWDKSDVYALQWFTRSPEAKKIVDAFGAQFNFDMMGELSEALTERMAGLRGK